MENKTILITGAAGYIGGTFSYEALKRGYKVVGLDNFSNSNIKNINLIKETFPKDFTFYEIDLLDENLIEKFKKHTGIHSVFHFQLCWKKVFLNQKKNPTSISKIILMEQKTSITNASTFYKEDYFFIFSSCIRRSRNSAY